MYVCEGIGVGYRGVEWSRGRQCGVAFVSMNVLRCVKRIEAFGRVSRVDFMSVRWSGVENGGVGWDEDRDDDDC